MRVPREILPILGTLRRTQSGSRFPRQFPPKCYQLRFSSKKECDDGLSKECREKLASCKPPKKGLSPGEFKCTKKQILTLSFPKKPQTGEGKVVEHGECHKPYVNPCPDYPPCRPEAQPIHPCAVRISRPYEPFVPSTFLSDRARKALFAATCLLSGYFLYRLLTAKQDDDDDKNKGIVCPKKPKPPPRYPTEAEFIPKETKYLIVGGGTAAFSAFRTIKNRDPQAKVLLFSDELYNPYNRAPLSKELLLCQDREMTRRLLFCNSDMGSLNETSIFFEPQEFYTQVSDFEMAEDGGICIVRGWKVDKIDSNKKVAKIQNGPEVKYDKCLIATGSRPKKISALTTNSDDVLARVTYLRNAADFLYLDEISNCREIKHVAVIGGDSVASEVSYALAQKGLQVSQITCGDGLMSDILPSYLSKRMTERMEKEGVTVVTNTMFDDAMVKEGKLRLVTEDEENIDVDLAIVVDGTEANTCLAKDSGLEVDQKNGGFLANVEMQIKQDLFTAGDCASFFHPLLGRRRLESHEHAVATGRIAGENMTGGKVSYNLESPVWSKIFPDVDVQYVGMVDSSLSTVAVFLDGKSAQSTLRDKMFKRQYDPDDEYCRGVVFYHKEGMVVGILLWNVNGRLSMAQNLLAHKIGYQTINEASKKFYMHL